MTAAPQLSKEKSQAHLRPPGRLHEWLVAIANLVGVLVIYFMLPVNSGLSSARLVLDVLATAAGVSVVAFVLFREVKRQGRDPSQPGLSGLRLILLLEIVLVIFSFTYYTLAINAPEQFHGLSTRIDSLYFSMVTTTTVGYGDVYAAGQAARAIVIAQIGFDVAFIAALSTLIRVHIRRNIGSDDLGDR